MMQRFGRGAWAMMAVLAAGPCLAQSPMPGGMPPPPGMSLAQSAAMRFPQPVKVGALVGRIVQWPRPDQPVLGRVQRIVTDPAGTISAVIAVGGVLGIGTRLIAVPVDGMVLLGAAMEVVAFTPEQIRAFPTVDKAGVASSPGAVTPSKTLDNETVIRVGLAKPSH